VEQAFKACINDAGTAGFQPLRYFGWDKRKYLSG